MAAEITLDNPVDAAGNLSLVRGDDYAVADGRAPTWTIENTDIELDSGWTIELTIAEVAGPYTGTVTEVTTDNFTIKVPLTAAQTALLWITNARYALQAIHAVTDGSVITLTSGRVSIRRPQGLTT